MRPAWIKMTYEEAKAIMDGFADSHEELNLTDAQMDFARRLLRPFPHLISEFSHLPWSKKT